MEKAVQFDIGEHALSDCADSECVRRRLNAKGFDSEAYLAFSVSNSGETAIVF
jgi:hypothetical protein